MNIQVTSVSKKEQKLLRTSAAIYVVTQDDIRRSGATNIPDLLRTPPKRRFQVFQYPAPGKFGNCGVSTERGPGIRQVDIGVSKSFPITERQRVEFRAEAINSFNTPIFTVNGYSIDVHGGSNEGVVNTSAGARNLQFALKYIF